MTASPSKARRSSPTADIVELHAAFCTVFSSPTRLRIMWLLGDSERAVGELAGALELPMANVSQHLRVMRDQGAVTSRRQGRSILYRIAHPKFTAGARLIREGLLDVLGRRGRARDVSRAPRRSAA